MAKWSKIGQDSKWQGFDEIVNILKHIKWCQFELYL